MLACQVLDSFPEEVVNLVLLGISKIWLKFPSLLLSNLSEDNLLSRVIQIVSTDRVSDESKVRILQSLHHFLLNLRAKDSDFDLVPVQKKLEVEI